MTIERKRLTRAYRITITIPLPRRWWQKRKDTPETRQHKSAAQRRRWAEKKADA